MLGACPIGLESTPAEVIISIAVWRQIAGTTEPGSFKGKVIQVQTTPQIVRDNYVNMVISTATQFRVVAAR